MRYLTATDAHGTLVRINLDNISYYYPRGSWVNICISGMTLTVTDITIEEMDQIFLEKE